MTSKGQHGGARQPGRPAAVSGPGALSQRTDGGPSDRQPIRVASGGAYGERQAAEQQQAAAPMAAGGPGGPSPGGTANAAPTAPGGDVFGPTSMPGQSIMTGVPDAPGQPLPDAKMVLGAIYNAYPSPWIASLLSD